MSKNKYYFSNSQGKIKISDMHTKHLYNAIEKLKKTSLTEFKDNKIVITIKGNETDELVINPQLLKNATSEPIISLGNVHYEILPTDKKLTLSFGEDVVLELNGRGNYGMKPNEKKVYFFCLHEQ